MLKSPARKKIIKKIIKIIIVEFVNVHIFMFIGTSNNKKIFRIAYLSKSRSKFRRFIYS